MLKKIFRKKKKEKVEKVESDKTFNVLLLGAAGSGKSTILKQIEKAFNTIEYVTEDIHNNILCDIHALCKYNIRLNGGGADNSIEYKLSTAELSNICNEIANWPNYISLELTKEYAIKIDKLWKDKAMKLTLQRQATSHHMDNTSYFMDKILQIEASAANNDYEATFDDYIRIRHQTTGIISKQFSFNDDNINVIDVGGTRSERRKWLKILDNINLVIYVMSLSGYNQFVYQDNTKNRMDEALDTFSKMISDENAQIENVIVILNKYDLLLEKLKRIPFSVYQPSFNEQYICDSEKVIEFIKGQFILRFQKFNKSVSREQILFLKMNAIDNPLDLAMYNRSYLVLDELLVIGYCKKCLIQIPNEIVKLCLKFYDYDEISVIQPILDAMESKHI